MTGVAAAAVGATPGHSAIVASLTAALTMAGEVTSRTRRPRGGDDLIAVKTLHTLIEGCARSQATSTTTG